MDRKTGWQEARAGRSGRWFAQPQERGGHQLERQLSCRKTALKDDRYKLKEWLLIEGGARNSLLEMSWDESIGARSWCYSPELEVAGDLTEPAAMETIFEAV